MTMLTDDDLEQLLATAAAQAPEPVDGPPELGDDEAVEARHRRRIPRWLPAAAVVLAALLIGRVVLDDPEQAADTAAGGTTATSSSGAGGGTGGGGLARTDPVSPELSGEAAPEAGANPVPGPPAAATAAPAAGGASGSVTSSAALGYQQVPGVQTRIVHDGSMELEVDEGGFAPTIERITGLVTGLGGHVSATQTTELGDSPRGTITVRVPANSFEQLLGEVRRLGDVESVATTGTDVTAQYTDLEARINALTDTRNQLQTVLSQAETIPDILAVRDHINAVQVEIESLEGQRRVLEDQSALGTLAVTVHEPGAPTPEPVTTDDDGGLGGAWDEAERGFGDAIEWLVARSGKGLVLAALALALYAIGVFTWGRVRRAQV